MRLRRIVSVSVAVLLAMSQLAWPMLANAAQPTPPAPPASGPQFVPDQILIQFKAGLGVAEKARARGAVGAAQVEVLRASARGDLELASLPPGLNVPAAARVLEAQPGVAFAEPNWVYTHQATSNDPYYTGGNLWGMEGDKTTPTNPYGSQAGEAWAAGYTGSNTVYVGVIDEGFQFTHPELSQNVWTNSSDPPDGIDNDTNGYVDDVHGWDFYNNDNSIYDGTSDNHGTHVSGTIGAKGGNGAGVAGVNWNVTLISAKFLGPNGGYTSDAVKAVDYLTNLKTQHGVNVVATNNSWGGGGYSQALHDAIIRAANANILFVAAAGNGDRFGRALNNDSTANYPSNYNTSIGTSTQSAASYDAVIAVAAIDSSGNKASWSNYGATTVDLGAPGVSINSTLPTDSYGSYSGTSMATPHVTGAAALYASTHPGATGAQIKAAILNSTIPTASLAGKTVTGGRLDVGTLLGAGGGQDTTPPETTITSRTPSASPTNSTSVSFTFSSSETASTFSCRLDSGATMSCNSGSQSYTGLGEGAHTFSVAATDAANNTDPTPAQSTWTVDLTAPTTTITDGPADGSSTTSTSASFSFTATEPSTFQCNLDNAGFSACVSPESYSGLAGGDHTFQVRATDPAGNTGPAASRSWTITTSTPPPVTGVSVASIDPITLPAGSSPTPFTITGTGFVSGATVTFENGLGPTPSVSAVKVVDSATITATVSVGSGGPKGSRRWDVRVTNLDGSTGVKTGAFTVTR